ncbi:hypothetical protein J7J84_01175 [bacterium]|nr:hypothetical protein [bacterium]
MKSVCNSTVWIVLVILFATQLQASEITSVSSANHEGRVVLTIEADGTPAFEQHIDYAEWMMLVDFPGFSLRPALIASSYDFPEEVAEWVRSYRLEDTPVGTRLVLLLGERATPLRINLDPIRNGLTVIIPTADAEEGMLTVPLGFMDPPISFWEVAPTDRAYRVTPLQVQPLPEEREGVTEATPAPEPAAIADAQPSPYTDGLLSFTIPQGIEELPPGGEVEGMNEEQNEPSTFELAPVPSEEPTPAIDYDFNDFVHPQKARSEDEVELAVIEPAVEANPEPAPAVESKPEPEPQVVAIPEPEPLIEALTPPEPVVEALPEPEPAENDEATPITELLTEEQLLDLAEHPGETVIRLDEGQYVKAESEIHSDTAVSSELPPEPETERPSWTPAKNRPVSKGARKHHGDTYPWDVKRPKSVPEMLPEKEWLTLPLLDRERVTLEWVDGPLNQAISLMVASTSFNVIIDDAVSNSNITLSFRDTPLREALETLTAVNDLSYSVVHNTIIVGIRDDVGRRLGGYITRAFQLDYADAEAVKQVLIDNGLVAEENVGVYNGEASQMPIKTGGTYLSEGEGGVNAGDIREMDSLISTARRNTLIVTETPKKMDVIAQVVADIDRKPKIVTLETNIVEVTEDGLSKLGFEVPDTISTNLQESTPQGATGIAMGLWLQTFYRDPYRVLLNLQTQIESGNARILSRPNLSAIDGTQAIYFAGRLVPYITRPATETGGTFTPPEVDFQAVGITLSFKPRVDNDNNITIEVNPSVSTLLQFVDIGSGVSAPDTQTRQITATIRVKDGETFVIAGLLSEEERENLRRIPLLGDLPLFGKLFQSKHKTRERTEIMVFVTPTVHE